MPRPIVTPVEISWLKQHPRQREFFPPKSESEIEELAADLVQRGQQEPIHCTTDGTIVRGHRRVQAARRLGWITIEGVVRDDLGCPTSDDAVNEMVIDNYMRQNLDDLAIARCFRQLKKSLSRSPAGHGDTRDRLAARLGCGKSGRSLDRLVRLLDLPRELQDMISRGELKKFHGEQILRLSQESQTKLVRQLREGSPISKLLRDFGIVDQARKKGATDEGQELLNFLHKKLPRLRDHVSELGALQIHGGNAAKVVEEAAEFFACWRDHKRQLHQESLEEIRPACVGLRSRTN